MKGWMAGLMGWRPGGRFGAMLAILVVAMGWLVFAALPRDPLGFFAASCEAKEFRYVARLTANVDGIAAGAMIPQVERRAGPLMVPMQRYYNLPLPDGRVLLVKARSVAPEGGLVRPAAGASDAFIADLRAAGEEALDVVDGARITSSLELEGAGWHCERPFAAAAGQELDVAWGGDQPLGQYSVRVAADVFIQPEGYASVRMKTRDRAESPLYRRGIY